MKSTNVEVLQPPIPKEALLAKAVQPDQSFLAKQVEDLRLMVEQLSTKVRRLEEIAYERGTVCGVCGKPDCREAPHIPYRYWARFGPYGIHEYQRDDPRGWREAVYEHESRRRQREYTASEMRALPPFYPDDTSFFR